MRTVVLQGNGNLAEWREAARGLLGAGVPPQEVDWRTAEAGGLFAEGAVLPASAPPPPRVVETRPPRVPQSFIDLAEAVICHADPGRFALLYRLLVRLQADRRLLSVPVDADVVAARRMEKAVRRDCHKMTAFVRFREVAAKVAARTTAKPAADARRRFVAWFEPDHHIIARIAPFFARRFADMDWMIFTPRGSAALEDGALTVSDTPAEKPDLADPTDALWLTYYASIFNPARVKVKAMQAEMPKKYWANLPEATLIPDLIAGAPARVAAMAAQMTREAPAFHARLQAKQWIEETPPPPDSMAGLREAARACTRCPLHCHATQTVFGEGPEDAEVMVVGEQPGDQEDLAGRPFVGPAGQVFDAIAREAGLDRSKIYVTNAVKHFKHEPRGKRRLHRTPNAGEVEHCRFWLRKEIDLVKPKLVVAMGATALAGLTGAKARLADLRGKVLPFETGRGLLVSVHPAYLLRLPDAGRREAETRAFRDDLTRARHWLASGAAIAAPRELARA